MKRIFLTQGQFAPEFEVARFTRAWIETHTRIDCFKYRLEMKGNT